MIRLGIIGLGEVAQLMHLPVLGDLRDMYSIEAVSDISPSLVSYICDKYNIKNSYSNPYDLVERANIDAVIILSPDEYHCEFAKAALKAGKHVFIEKPVALNMEDLQGLIEEEKKHPNLIVMVGYMRRFAGPFMKAGELLARNRKVEYLRFRDVICEAPFYIGQTRKIFYPKDVTESMRKESQCKRREKIDKAIGSDATDVQRTTYQMLTGLGCHSFSAVRELLGPPKEVREVVTSKNGEQVVIVFEYDDFIGTYELVNNQSVVQFDAAIEIFQGSRKLKVKYETPYIRYMPSLLEVTESNAKDTRTTVYGPDYNDPFQTELIEFYSCITELHHPKTTVNESLYDLKLFKEIIDKMSKKV